MIRIEEKTPESIVSRESILDEIGRDLIETWTATGDRSALCSMERNILSAPGIFLHDIISTEAWRGDYWHPEDLPFPKRGDIIYKGRCLSWSTSKEIGFNFAENWLDAYYDILEEYYTDRKTLEPKVLDSLYEIDENNDKFVFAGRPYVMYVKQDDFLDLAEVSEYPNEKELLSMPDAAWKVTSVDTKDTVVFLEVVPI